MKIRIYYEDTDAGGVVYHTNYIKFCERARSEILFSHGSSPAINDGHMVVKSLCADFLKPAILGNMLEVKSEILKLSGASMELRQDIFRDSEKIFTLTILLVFVKDGKLCKFEESHKELLQKLFGNN